MRKTCNFRGCDSTETSYIEWKTKSERGQQIVNMVDLCEACYDKLLHTAPRYTFWAMGSRRDIQEIWIPDDDDQEEIPDREQKAEGEIPLLTYNQQPTSRKETF